MEDILNHTFSNKNSELEPISLSDGKLHEIVRQFTNVADLADLQADIFGCSSHSEDLSPALTLPAYLEPVAEHGRSLLGKRKLSGKSPLSEQPPLPPQQQQQQQQQRVTQAANPLAPELKDPSNNKRRRIGLSVDEEYQVSSNKLNHNRSERERRQKIKESNESLRVLLPPQCQEVAGNKLTILQESVGYLRHMKESYAQLQQERQRADEQYRRLWEDYRNLRHYVSVYTFMPSAQSMPMYPMHPNVAAPPLPIPNSAMSPTSAAAAAAAAAVATPNSPTSASPSNSSSNPMANGAANFMPTPSSPNSMAAAMAAAVAVGLPMQPPMPAMAPYGAPPPMAGISPYGAFYPAFPTVVGHAPCTQCHHTTCPGVHAHAPAFSLPPKNVS